MSTIQVSFAVDLHNVATWYGDITRSDSGEIDVRSGPLQGSYTGNFTYDNLGHVGGNLTGFSEALSGSPIISLAGLNVSAADAARLINANDIQSLLQLALSGDDQFTLSPGTHTIDGYGGFNSVAESASYFGYNLANDGGVVQVDGAGSHDTLYNVQRVDFADGAYSVQSGIFTPNAGGPTNPATGNSNQAAIQALYQSVLGRDADPAGLAQWGAELAGGTPLATIRAIGAYSDEARADIEAIYQTVLGRAADSNGLAQWTGALARGASLATIRMEGAQSGEAQANIQAIYQAVLGRAADPDGLRQWTHALANGTSLATMRAEGAHSGEAQADIQAVYQSVLGRAADPAGLAQWTDALARGASLAAMRVAGGASSEAAGAVAAAIQAGGATPAPAVVAVEQVQLECGLSLADVAQQALALRSGPVFVGGNGLVVDRPPTNSAPQPGLFVFGAGPLGDSQVQGFLPQDMLELSRAQFQDYATVQSRETSHAYGTTIALDAANSITVVNVAASALHPANFLFV